MAPEVQIKAGIFTQKLNKDSLRNAVQARAEAFSSELISWVDKWFFPTLEAIHIGALSWETLIADIESNDAETFQSLEAFYARCLIHNKSGVQLKHIH